MPAVAVWAPARSPSSTMRRTAAFNRRAGRVVWPASHPAVSNAAAAASTKPSTSTINARVVLAAAAACAAPTWFAAAPCNVCNAASTPDNGCPWNVVIAAAGLP